MAPTSISVGSLAGHIGAADALGGKLPMPVNLGFHALLAAACVFGIAVRRRRFHEALDVTCAEAIAVYIGVHFTHLT